MDFLSLILLDHNTPYRIARLLPKHRVEVAYRRGWDRLKNGALLKAAEEAGFEVMVTCDKNLQYQ